MNFKLKSDYQPTGDQPQAIDKLTRGILAGKEDQVLLGVTGSGKTFTIANVIEKVQKSTLVMAHNKTLAAQLYQEFREFFPENAVSYFVSYYDFYQPEAYIPRTDTYIEKETEINEEIDKLRLAATTSLLTRKDVIVVASVSCIYGLGNPVEYGKFILELEVAGLHGPAGHASQDLAGKLATDTTDPVQVGTRRDVLVRLTELQYERSEFDFKRGTFRVKGDNLDIFPSYEDSGIRVEFLENKIQKMTRIDPLTGKVLENLEKFVVYPAKHYMTDPATYHDVFEQIRKDTTVRVKEFKSLGKLLEAQRLEQRVNYDLEMIQEVGFVNGIENYSRYFDRRKPGEPPYTLLDYFPKDYLLVVDESHMTIPQVRGMYNGDRSRKQTLVDFGFRLPAALDNRPLRFDEFIRRKGQTIYTSATPDEWERERAKETTKETIVVGSEITVKDDRGRKRGVSDEGIVEQLIRPTGIVDPEVEVRPTKGQIQDLIEEIKEKIKDRQRILVTTLTKRMAEELTDYLKENAPGVKTAYLHSDIQTFERSGILKKLRVGEFDVLVGINLLREGLDLPEVGLVAILDADKEGFLRSEVSLVQTMGRAARNIEAKVILYADSTTGSMKRAMDEVRRRRERQMKWNKEHGIMPSTVVKPIRGDVAEGGDEGNKGSRGSQGKRGQYLLMMDEELREMDPEQLLPEQRKGLKKVLERRMKEAARILDFEGAAFYRDYLKKLE